MFSCDYNGWADVPEDEREALDAFEAGVPRELTSPPVAMISPPRSTLAPFPQRRAA
jgi:hypothetical protein